MISTFWSHQRNLRLDQATFWHNNFSRKNCGVRELGLPILRFATLHNRSKWPSPRIPAVGISPSLLNLEKRKPFRINTYVPPASVDSNGFIQTLSCLKSTLTKNRGGWSYLLRFFWFRPMSEDQTGKQIANRCQPNHHCRHLPLVAHQIRQCLCAIANRQVTDSEVTDRPR